MRSTTSSAVPRMSAGRGAARLVGGGPQHPSTGCSRASPTTWPRTSWRTT